MEVSYLQNNDPNIVLERANYHKAEAKTYHIYAVAVLVAFVAISTLAIAVVAFMAAESMLLSVMFLTLSFKVVHSLYRPLILVHYAHKTAFATETAWQ